MAAPAPPPPDPAVPARPKTMTVYMSPLCPELRTRAWIEFLGFPRNLWFKRAANGRRRHGEQEIREDWWEIGGRCGRTRRERGRQRRTARICQVFPEQERASVRLNYYQVSFASMSCV
ncbi:hypothetical protein EJB05_55460, partial [Eragrostis curvula]